VVVLGGIKISDLDGTFLQSATVTVGNLQAGDTLTAATAGTNLIASYQNGVLTISGSATVATYLKALKSVKLLATGGVGLARTLTVTVNDGDLTSAETTRTVTML
jgi:hypothetical protein